MKSSLLIWSRRKIKILICIQRNIKFFAIFHLGSRIHGDEEKEQIDIILGTIRNLFILFYFIREISNFQKRKKKNLLLRVRKRTIPTERPPKPESLVATFADRGCCMVNTTDPYGSYSEFC
jgi:hypothetical protein